MKLFKIFEPLPRYYLEPSLNFKGENCFEVRERRQSMFGVHSRQLAAFNTLEEAQAALKHITSEV